MRGSSGSVDTGLGTPGFSIFGAARPRSGSPGRTSLWRFVLLALVATLGFLYAAPNLFTPDFALQVTVDNAERPVDDALLGELEAALGAAGIVVENTELVPDGGLLRLASSDDQLRGSTILRFCWPSAAGRWRASP